MPMNHWLNIGCIQHTKLETLQDFEIHHLIGWILQDFWETCGLCFLTVHLVTKPFFPSRKKEAKVFTTVIMSAYEDQRNNEFIGHGIEITH